MKFLKDLLWSVFIEYKVFRLYALFKLYEATYQLDEIDRERASINEQARKVDDAINRIMGDNIDHV